MVCQEKELLTSTLVINWNYPNGMICTQIRVQMIKLITIQLFNNETPCEISCHTHGSWSCESRMVPILTCVWTCFIHWKLIPWFISRSHEFFCIQTKITWQTWRWKLITKIELKDVNCERYQQGCYNSTIGPSFQCPWVFGVILKIFL
mgnify:CR=1 FL=1